MKKENKKAYKLIVLIALVIALIGGSYAWLRITLSGGKVNVIKAGALSLALKETNEVGIQEDGAIPVTDQTGLATEGFTFTLENNGTIASNYIIYLDDVELEEGEERIPDNAIKYVLTKNGETSLPALLNTTGKNPNRKLDIGKLEPGEKNTYELKAWIDYNADNSIMGKVFLTKLRVESFQEIDGWNGENDPTKNYDMIVDPSNPESLVIDMGGANPTDYTYESSDPEVAEIDENGNIIPKGPGEVTVIIIDKDTGETIEKIIKIEETVTIDFGGDTGLDIPSASCKLTEKDQTECTITLPEVEVGEEEIFSGWKKEGSDEVIPPGTKVTVSEGDKFIPVIESKVTVKTATFDKNGVGVQSIGEESLQCTIEGDKCYLTLPEIVAKDGYEVIGWSTNQNITDKTEEERNQIFAPGDKIVIEEDTTYYAISKSKEKTYTARFYRNGASSQDGVTDEYIEKNCTIDSAYNNEQQNTSCAVISPIIIGNSNTPNVVGYSDEANKTETIINANTEFQLSGNEKYYAITTNGIVTKTAKFIKNGDGVSSIGDTDEIIKNCTISATYNGKKQEDNCSIMPPSIIVKNGYTQRGWSQNQNANTVATDSIGANGYLPVNQAIQIYSDTEVIYYSISSKDEIIYEVNFHLNGATSQDGSTEEILTKSCNIAEVYNNEIQDTTCTITLPTIEASTNTPTVVGYAESQDATVGIEGTEIIVSSVSNRDYYAITKKDSEPVYINYILNNSTSFTLDSQKYTNDLNTLACNKPVAWNGARQEACQVTLATIEGSTNTPKVIGWSNAENTHEATYESGQANVSLNNDITLYAQTKKDEVTYTIGSYNIGKNISSIDKDNAKTSCKINATYNGEKQDESCTIEANELPSVTAKRGYEYAGWTKVGATSTNGNPIITLTSENTGKDWYAYAIGNSFKIEYYSNGTKDSEETLQVSNSIPLKTLQKEGYTFKGWDTDSSATTVVYSSGENATDLTPSKGDVIKLYAVWTDETKPVCTWSTAPTTTIQNTAEIKLTCTDNGSGLSEQTLTKENIEVSATTYGEITTVSAPTAVENGYEYIITIKGLSSSTEGTTTENIPGEFKILIKENSIRDNSNNGNKEVQSDNILVYGRSYTATFTKNGNGVDAIGATSDSCITKGTNTTCEITAPSISVLEGYKVVGWNKDSNAVTGTTPGEVITLSEDATYYTIYKQDRKEYTAVFHLNGATALDGVTQDITRKCTIDEVYNDTQIQATSCKVQTPVISASSNTPTVLGFATTNSETDTSKMINTSNEIIDVSIDSDIDYYAITKKDAITYYATYIKNGLGVTSIEKESDECTIDATYNGTVQSTTCSLTTPSITVANGYESVGWAISDSEENSNNVIKANTNIDLNENIRYYSISKKTPVTYTATFNLNGAGTQTKTDGTTVSENVTRTCQTDITWNNTSPDTDCVITTPELTGSTNTPDVLGYNETKTATINTINQNEDLTISNDVTYYAITKKDAVALTANWNANNATLSKTEPSTCNLSAVYNGTKQDTSCKVDAPTITAPTNTPDVLGYNTTKDANQNNSSYNKETGKLTLTEANTGNTWYAQTKKDEITYTVGGFEKGSNVSSVGTKTDENSKCTIAETYNGTAQAKSCNVTAPSITAKTGYTSVGWSLTSGDTTGSSVITLTSSNTGKTWYANAAANSYTIKYYDGTTLKGTSSAKVDTYPTLTKASNLSLSKIGYTFKGWSTTNGGAVAYTDGQTLTTNLATTAGEEVSLYAVWADETKPVCTWSAIGTTTTQNTTTGTLTCTDTGSGVVQKTLSPSNFTITANGEITAVSSPTAITNGYNYTVTINGLSVGTYTVSLNSGVISDNAGNTNEAAASSSATVNGRTYTATFTKNGGVSTLSKTTDSCTTTGSNLTCDITVPTVTLESNYNLIGWNTSSSATTSIASDNKVTLSDDTTYYTISKKNAVTLTANWNANGANLSSGTQSTCTIAEVYNTEAQKDSCSITAPTITRSGFTIVGFNDSKDATTASFGSGATVYLSSSGGTNSEGITTYASGKTWYAITNKKITITWDSNGETVGATQTTCVIQNSATSCNITTPTIEERDGRVILGWYTTSGTKFADPGVSKSVSENATYIATSRALTASEVEYNNSSSGLNCTNAQCAVDEINTILSQ